MKDGANVYTRAGYDNSIVFELLIISDSVDELVKRQ